MAAACAATTARYAAEDADRFADRAALQLQTLHPYGEVRRSNLDPRLLEGFAWDYSWIVW